MILFFLLLNPSEKTPAAENGILDLTNWDFEKDGSIKLDGEWEFYWNQLLTYDDFHDGIELIKPDGYFKVPGVWNNYIINGKKLPGKGFATYRLKIKTNDADTLKGLKILTFSTAFRLAINNEVIAKSGVVGKNKDMSVPEYHPQAVGFQNKTKDFEIIVQISNYTYARGGFWHSIHLGTDEQIRTMKENSARREMFLLGAMLIMIFYHAAIYLLQRRRLSVLYIVLGLLAFLIRILFTGEYYITSLIPGIPFNWIILIEYITIYWGPGFFILLIYELFPDEFPKQANRVTVSGALVFTILTTVTPVYVYTKYLIIPEILIMAACLYTLFGVVVALIRKREGAKLLLISIIIGSLSFINDFLYYRNAIPSIPGGISGIVTFIVIFIMAYILAKRFSNAFNEIEKLSEKLASLNILKDEFLTNTSHELRTPVNSMIAITESVIDGAEGEINPQQKNTLSLVVESGRRLASLINDLLDLSRIKNGELSLQKSLFKIDNLVKNLIREFEFTALNKNVTLKLEITAALSSIYADKYRIIQIFYNLIENAVKFTPSGGNITVRVYEEKKYICISVSDTGIGIPEHKLNDIFKAFEQVDASITRKYGGMGLGLSISKKIAEAHDGDIRVNSILNEGSEFIFYIPVTESENEASADEEQLAEINQMKIESSEKMIIDGEKNETIVIIDDNYSNIAGVMGILKTQGYSVKGFMHPDEGLAEIFTNTNTALAVVDLMMPEISGYEICKRIRARYSLYEMPILILTARTQVDSIVKSFKEGANDILHKPFDAEELTARVNTLCSLKTTAKAAISSEMAMLQAQIKPHFLFNALSSIISLCYTDGHRAGKILAELSNYLKCSFAIDRQSDFVTVKSELEHVKCFVDIEKERFGDRIKMVLDVDPDVLSHKIIPLVIEPLVENALRHGILQNKLGGMVNLAIMKRNGNIFVSVEDNGKGMSERHIGNILPWDETDRKISPGNGIGLSNINNRLKRFYGEELHFETGPQGTKVYFTVPLVEKREAGEDD
jgi:signal transduction histidine kinase